MLRVGIAAGESSGDLLGAGLIKAIKELVPEATFVGIAGPLMIEQGCQPLFHTERLSVFGIVEVFKHLPELLGIRRSVSKYFLRTPPDVFIGIDAPDFNLPLERKLKRHGITTVHYVSPTVWAWRKSRIKGMLKAIDLVLSIFPFEVEFLEKHKINVKYVGHPLADMIPEEPDQAMARQKLGLPANQEIIALLPGSRNSEIRFLAREFLKTAEWCHQQRPGIHFVVPLVTPAIAAQFAKIHAEFEMLPITLINGESRSVIESADAVLTASGTATLETLLLKRPMVAAYKVSALTHWLLTRFKMINVQFFSMPNLLAGYRLINEYYQDDICSKKMGNVLLDYLQNPERKIQVVNEYMKIGKRLRLDASHVGAEAILALINTSNQSNEFGNN